MLTHISHNILQNSQNVYFAELICISLVRCRS